MTAINIKAFTKNTSEVDAIKAFMKALKIKFELMDEMESPYDATFVKMINKGKKEISDNKGIKMTPNEFKALCK